MIRVFTIVSDVSDQEFTQQQKPFDIPSARIYLARPWRIADISGNVVFVIHPGRWPTGNIEQQLSNFDNILWRRKTGATTMGCYLWTASASKIARALGFNLSPPL